MNNDNKVETAIAGVHCWASYAAGRVPENISKHGIGKVAGLKCMHILLKLRLVSC